MKMHCLSGGRVRMRKSVYIPDTDRSEMIEMKMTSAKTGSATSFVFQATTTGTYHFDVTPIIDGQPGERRLNTLEVEE